jgi:microcystin-dependent protein
MLRARPDAVAVYSNAIAVDRDGKVIGQFNDVGDREFSSHCSSAQGEFPLHEHDDLQSGADARGEAHRRQVFIDYEMHLTHARHGVVLHCGARLAAYRVGSTGSALAHSNA